MVYDPRTTEYIDRRKKEGLTKKEAVRCLKRYVAREVYSLLPHGNWGLTAHRSIERDTTHAGMAFVMDRRQQSTVQQGKG